MSSPAVWMATIEPVVVALGDDLQRLRGELAAATSKGGVDVVTAADAYCEERLVAALRAQFPDHAIVAEEGTRIPGGAWCWHVDPLDGTANYARGLGDWAISLGLAYDGRPVAGLIVAPELGMHWIGGRDLAVRCNGTALSPAAPAAAQTTWLVGSDNPWDPLARARNLRLVSALACGIRMPLMRGSAAIGLGLLCSGHIDAYILAKAYSWDYCAGAALAASLGYTLTDWAGAAWTVDAPAILACRPGMEAALQAAIDATGTAAG